MRKPSTITVAIAEDHEIYLDGLISQFANQDRFELIAACRDGDHLLRSVSHREPDVVITDLRMPVVSGIEAIRHLTENHPRIRVLVLSTFDHELMIVDALEAGAKGYINKDSPKKHLFEAIETVYKDQPYYCRHTTTKLIRLISNSYFNPYQNQKKPLFSENEKKIIRLMCEDKSVKEMSRELSMAERTVEKYRAVVFNKMNVKTVAGVAIYAVKHRLFVIEQ